MTKKSASRKAARGTARRKAAAAPTRKAPATPSRIARLPRGRRTGGTPRAAAAPPPLPAARGDLAALAPASRGKATEYRGKYVYCIIQAEEGLAFGPIGIGSDPTLVTTVCWRDLAAVVSDAPVGIQDPTRDNVLAHQRVNEIVMQDHTVLPMSFGTVFKTRDDILEFLRSAHDAFADVLKKMENKLEFGLKVLWDRDAVIRQIENEDDDIRRLKAQIATQKGSTYFARMQYGRLVDAAMQVRGDRYVSDIFERLRDVAVASRSNKPIGDRMIMNAAFLVSRAQEAAFDARVKELGTMYDKLTFKYTGPWPPYNFVNIRLKLERA